MRRACHKACFSFLSFALILILLIFDLIGCSGIHQQPTPFNNPSQPVVGNTPTDHVITNVAPNGADSLTELAINAKGITQVGTSAPLISNGLVATSIQATTGHLYVNLAKINIYRDDPSQASFTLMAQVDALPGQSAFSTLSAVDPTGAFLYADATNGDGLSISGFRIQQNGTLSPVSGSVVGPLGDVGDTLRSIVFNDDGTKVYAMVLGVIPQGPSAAGLIAFKRDPQSGTLERIFPMTPAPLDETTFDFNLYRLQQGKYLANFRDAGLGVYTIDSQTGNVTEVTGSPFPLNLPPQPAGTSDILSLATDASGTFLYVSSNLNNQLSVFHLNNDGSIVPVPGATYVVPSPNALAVTNSDQFLAVTSSGAKSLFVFQRSPGTGLLTPLAGSPIAIGGTPLGVWNVLP